MMKYLYCIFGLLLIISCKHRISENKNDYYSKFKSTPGRHFLTIKSNIHDSTDCGEWGGHEEYFYISKDMEDSMHLSYYRETTKCMFPEDLKPGDSIQTYEGRLTQEKETLVQKFITVLYEHTCDGGSNAPDNYEVRIDNDSTFYGFTKRNCEDFLRKYEAFRDKIISEK